MTQKELGLNIQETSILQNTQNCGGTRSVKRNLKIIEVQDILRIEENSGISLRRPNVCFLISKSKKSQQKEEVSGNS